MFEPNQWNFEKFAADCKKKYGVGPRTDLAKVEFGGDRLQAASNIVFSNGLLDPWAAGLWIFIIKLYTVVIYFIT